MTGSVGGQAAELTARLGRLRPWAGAVLRLLVARFGPLPAEREDLVPLALAEGLSGAHVRAALLQLTECGILTALPKGWKENRYMLREGTLPAWQTALFPPLEPAAEEDPGLPEDSVEESGCASADVLQVMHAASNGELQLVKRGGLTRKAALRLERVLLARDGELAGSGIAAAGSPSCGPALAAVLHLAAASGLLAEEEGCWKPVEKAFGPWRELAFHEAQARLYRIWKDAVGPSMQAWEFHALAAVERAAPGRWYSLDQLFAWLRVCGMMDLDCMEQMDFISTRLVPMKALGWLRLKRQGAGAAFLLPLSLLAEPEAPDAGDPFAGIIVQPDLEILVPPQAPPRLLWALLQWGEWAVRGEVSVFRLTAGSLQNGRAASGSAEVLVKLLQECSQYDIDDGVIRLIREQGGGGAAAPASPAETGLPGLSGAPQEEAPPPLPCPAGMPEQEALSAARLEAGLTRLPADVPAAWWKPAQRYHPSTEKELIRRALALQTALGVSIAGGREDMLVPVRITEEEQGWSVHGMRGRMAVRLKPDEWTGLRLIWPGIHE